MKAAIDLGSNMAQLLIIDDQQREKIFQQFTSLGEGTFASNKLSDAAIARALKVLAEFIDILKAHKINPLEVVFCATEACRRATNREDFFKIITKLGFKPKLLNGQQEAFLGCLGAMSQLVNPSLDYVSMDIGGASTEIAILDTNCELHKYISLKVGTLAVTQWLKNSQLKENLEKIKSEHTNDLIDFQGKTLICTRGTMTSLFNIALDNREVEEKSFHGSQLSPTELIKRLKVIQSFTHEQLIQKYSYLDKRLPTLDAGIEIFLFICEFI